METAWDLVREMIGKIEGLAPQFWLIAQRQVYAEIALHAVWMVAMLVLIACGSWTIAIAKRRGPYTGKNEIGREIECDWDDRFLAWFGFLGIPAATIVFFVLASTVVKLAINPQWYAIQMILEML